MDFATIPPEINSGRMYSGPGPGPMLTAAAAWDGLASQLRSTAASYSSVISGLTDGWQGPSSTAMAAAATPYVAWLNATAAQAEQTATQATAAAAAYETAFAATVPPPVIAANRAELAELLAANTFGQQLPAIAAVEARYADMWAQDAAAMYGYAGQSSAAARVRPFAPPPQTTDPGAPATQSAAVARTTATSAGAGAQSILAQPMSQVPTALHSLATPTTPAQSLLSSLGTVFLLDVLNPFGSLSPVDRGLEVLEATGPTSLPIRNALVSSTLGFGLAARGFQDGQLPVPLVPGVLYPPVANPAATALSAELGGAGPVGALSVPPSWAAATPTVRLAATVLHSTGPAAAPLVAAGEASLFGQMALGSLAGGAAGGAASRAAAKVVARETGSGSEKSQGSGGADGKDGTKQDKLNRVLAELSQKPESVQHWHTDKAHLDGLLDQLSSKPGVHTVHVSSRYTPRPPQPRWG